MSTSDERAQALRVVSPAGRVPDVASGPMRREAAISRALVGAQKIWFGYAELSPSAVSAVHHHGDAESGIYIISGDARFFTGEQLELAADAHAGDFVWVPPHVVHVEANLSTREPVRMVVARSTQASLTFNLSTPEGWNADMGSAHSASDSSSLRKRKMNVIEQPIARHTYFDEPADCP